MTRTVTLGTTFLNPSLREARLETSRFYSHSVPGQKKGRFKLRASAGQHIAIRQHVARRELVLLPLLQLCLPAFAHARVMAGVSLKNDFWILRHARSIPNEQGLIVSSLENGVLPQYELAPLGLEQARNAGKLLSKELQDTGTPLDKVLIYASPFSRTKHTAELVASVLDPSASVLQIQFLEDLRERYFGPGYELQSHDLYQNIFNLDQHDPMVGPEGGESVADVARRVVKVILDLENKHEGRTILLVSHGDPLQILQTVVEGAEQGAVSLEKQASEPLSTAFEKALVPSVLANHRRHPIQNAELRRLV